MQNNHQPPATPKPSPRGWHSRGYLPHFDAGQEFTQIVTFRLADSVPNHVIAKWQDELLCRPETERETELHRLIETFLDTGWGACHLCDQEIASLVEESLLFFDGTRYALHAWIVMPNHVHTLFTPITGWSLSKIVGSWKSFTAKEANQVLGRMGQFWQEDYFDRYVRNEHHFHRVIEYTECNPVAAGLCAEPSGWRFGSAHRRLGGCAAGTAALRGEKT